MKTKTIPAGTFKAQCLAIMDEVQAKRQAVVITKRGKPVAKLVPVEKDKDDIFGFYKGKKTHPRRRCRSRIDSRGVGRSLLILLDTHVVVWLALTTPDSRPKPER